MKSHIPSDQAIRGGVNHITWPDGVTTPCDCSFATRYPEPPPKLPELNVKELYLSLIKLSEDVRVIRAQVGEQLGRS